MSEAAELTRAKFIPQSGKDKGKEIVVHFNPVSLQYTVTNTLDKGQGNNTKQYVSQSTGKLTMDLIFDTTHNGEDIRIHTDRVARFMEPDENKIPPIVLFTWGAYQFQGMAESYKETIDFFAPNGVPLRASVNLTLSRQDKVFEPSGTSRVDTHGALSPEPVEVPRADGQDATGTGAQGGDPRAGRSIAALNGVESMRFPNGPSLTLDPSVPLGPPVGSITGGAGGALGVGGGRGVDGALSVGASGGGAANPFAGLRAAARGPRPTGRLDLDRLMPRSEPVALATARGASFRVGGQAALEASASLGADVGLGASLRPRISFEEG